jgi:hypothetical protein
LERQKKPIARRRRRRRGTGRKYFTKDHEDAILEYVATDDIAVRTKLYVNLIGPAFNEMVDKIVYTYRFNSLPNIDSLKDECKIWLVTILDKYDPQKAKAFSYFSVITKNWFIAQTKKKAKRNRQEVELGELSKELELKYISINNPYQKKRESKEFFGLLNEEIDSWEHENMKESEKKVLEAVKILFDSVEDIEIFNKKAIYLYLREITGLNTKQVVSNLNKMRLRYRVFKFKWDEGDL